MFQCTVCGLSTHTGNCPNCQEAYKRDLANNHFPKGYSKENYTFGEWCWIKTRTKFLRQYGYDEEHVRKTIYEESIQRNALREQQKRGIPTTHELEEQKKYTALYDSKNDPF